MLSRSVVRGEAGGSALPAFRFALAVLALAFSFLASGCRILPAPQADAARFYTLGEKLPAAVSAPPAPIPSALRLGLARVELPAYLQNRAMVVRIGSEVRYEQNHRWAEPLDEGIARVVRASLLASPKVAAVVSTPFPIDQPRDYDVTVRIVHCEGERVRPDPFGPEIMSVKFLATIELVRADASHTVLMRKQFEIPAKKWLHPERGPDPRDFELLASLLGQAAAALGDATVAALPAQR